MKAVLSVIGRDRVGIVHEISAALANHRINILDINQTLMEDYFTMIMLVDLKECDEDFDDLVDCYSRLGEEMGMSIRIQHQALFDAMHQL